MKTIQELNQKMGYRFIKSIYILLFFSIAGGILVGVAIYGIKDSMDILSMGAILIILEVFRRIFYYTVLGTIFPKKD